MRHFPGIRTRPATPADAAAIAEIYNQGIAERIATFETESRTPAQIAAWLKPGNLVIVAAFEGKGPVAFAASFPYSPRPCYTGIGEFSVYAARFRRDWDPPPPRKLDGIWRDCVIVERLLGDRGNGADR